MQKNNQSIKENKYASHFEEDMAMKIDGGTPLTKEEFEKLVNEWEEVRYYNEESDKISSIVGLCANYYRIDWKETESEKQFHNQPYHVACHGSWKDSASWEPVEQNTPDVELE